MSTYHTHQPLERAGLIWVVCLVKPQAEQRAAAELSRAGLVGWCPLVSERRYWRRKRVMRLIEKPLLPRYVLAGVEWRKGKQISTALECESVIRVLSMSEDGRAMQVPLRDIRRIRELLVAARNRNNGRIPEAINVGEVMLVSLSHGEEKEITVTAVERDGQRVKGLISMLGINAPVTVGASKLRRGAA